MQYENITLKQKKQKTVVPTNQTKTIYTNFWQSVAPLSRYIFFYLHSLKQSN